MSVLSGLGSPNLTAGKPSNNAFGDLSSEEFVKIMFTELSKQDPLKPNDTSALLEQMSSLRSIQSNIELSQKLDRLVQQNEFASAGGMIGKYISGISLRSERVIGRVESVSMTIDGPILNLHNGTRVAFGQVDEMIDLLPQGTGGSTGTDRDTPGTDSGGDDDDGDQP